MAHRNGIARRKLDSRLSRVKALADEPRPHRGWIRAIREALGMSTTELATRMGIGQSRIPALEQGEQRGSIKLETLERAADALDCDLVYALVPRTSLEQAVRAQSRRKAGEHLTGIAHHMLLEDQATSAADTEVQLDELAERFVDHRGLWTEPEPSR
jgi:predicted DNA-binding mobile mystery protein A